MRNAFKWSLPGRRVISVSLAWSRGRWVARSVPRLFRGVAEAYPLYETLVRSSRQGKGCTKGQRRMRRRAAVVVLAGLAAAALGCSRADPPQPASGTSGYETLELRYQGNNG